MSTARVIKYVAGAYRTNVYLVYDEETKEAFIVDPGYEFPKIYDDIQTFGLKPMCILLTHGHGDHTGGIGLLKKTYPDIKLIASAKERKFLYNRSFSLGKGGIRADIEVSDGDELEIGNIKLKFISTPGHTPGGMCILMDDILFSGDTLFRMSVGRTDLPGGDEKTLLSSVKEKLMILPDETVVLPGHMEETTIGIERRYNPFV